MKLLTCCGRYPAIRSWNRMIIRTTERQCVAQWVGWVMRETSMPFPSHTLKWHDPQRQHQSIEGKNGARGKTTSLFCWLCLCGILPSGSQSVSVCWIVAARIWIDHRARACVLRTANVVYLNAFWEDWRLYVGDIFNSIEWGARLRYIFSMIGLRVCSLQLSPWLLSILAIERWVELYLLQQDCLVRFYKISITRLLILAAD